jgi:hypothetical protein
VASDAHKITSNAIRDRTFRITPPICSVTQVEPSEMRTSVRLHPPEAVIGAPSGSSRANLSDRIPLCASDGARESTACLR